jgi:hypothetical protein
MTDDECLAKFDMMTVAEASAYLARFGMRWGETYVEIRDISCKTILEKRAVSRDGSWRRLWRHPDADILASQGSLSPRPLPVQENVGIADGNSDS